MKTTWDKSRYIVSIVLIAITLAFSASIWNSPPSLAYLAILYSSGFAAILTLSWAITLYKSKYGLVILVANLCISGFGIIYLMRESGVISNGIRMLNIIANYLCAAVTIGFGILHFNTIKNTHNIN
jgi:CHASE2 domain-containing sensor protein